MQDKIIQAVLKVLADAQVFVDSPDGQHYQAVVVSAQFEGLPLVRQHQLVMNALKSEFDSNRVHAMRLKTMTPKQYEATKR